MKCKYHKICPLYNKKSEVCKNAGMYYADGTEPAGCYSRLEEAEEFGRLKEEAKEMGENK